MVSYVADYVCSEVLEVGMLLQPKTKGAERHARYRIAPDDIVENTDTAQ